MYEQRKVSPVSILVDRSTVRCHGKEIDSQFKADQFQTIHSRSTFLEQYHSHDPVQIVLLIRCLVSTSPKTLYSLPIQLQSLFLKPMYLKSGSSSQDMVGDTVGFLVGDTVGFLVGDTVGFLVCDKIGIGGDVGATTVGDGIGGTYGWRQNRFESLLPNSPPSNIYGSSVVANTVTILQHMRAPYMSMMATV